MLEREVVDNIVPRPTGTCCRRAADV